MNYERLELQLARGVGKIVAVAEWKTKQAWAELQTTFPSHMLLILLNPLGCGYAGKDLRGEDIEIHDHEFRGIKGNQTNKVAHGFFKNRWEDITERYDPQKHGKIKQWANEGDIIPIAPKKNRRLFIHKHGKHSNLGVYELGDK